MVEKKNVHNARSLLPRAISNYRSFLQSRKDACVPRTDIRRFARSFLAFSSETRIVPLPTYGLFRGLPFQVNIGKMFTIDEKYSEPRASHPWEKIPSRIRKNIPGCLIAGAWAFFLKGLGLQPPLFQRPAVKKGQVRRRRRTWAVFSCCLIVAGNRSVTEKTRKCFFFLERIVRSSVNVWIGTDSLE